MSYTIQSASWADAGHSSAILQTAEAGAVAVSPDRSDLWLQFAEWASSHSVSDYAAPDTTQILRDAAIALLVGSHEPGVAQRAVAAVLVDEVNALRGWITAFKAAVAAATSLADLKTRVAGLAAMPDRTLVQAKSAIQGKVTDGTAD